MVLTLRPFTLKVVIDYLKAQSDVNALVSGRVSSQLPSGDPTGPGPRIKVTRIGGVPPRHRADQAHLQIEAWGRTEVEAWQVARTAFEAMIYMPQVQPGGVVTDVAPSLGMTWQPDATFPEPKPRVIFGCICTSHP